MGDSGNIWFATRDIIADGRPFVEFRIGNDGPLVPQEECDRLFEAFYTRNKIGGTGLGLAIAQKIVHAHGGQIRCEAKPEVGVEFILSLPAAVELGRTTSVALPASSCALRAGDAAAEPEAAAADSTPEIVLIEDNAVVAMAWELANLGATLNIFDSPTAFWTAVGANPAWLDRISCVVTDFYFDNETAENGEGVAQRLRERNFSRPILISTDATFEDASFNGVVDALISKDPCSWPQIQKICGKNVKAI